MLWGLTWRNFFNEGWLPLLLGLYKEEGHLDKSGEEENLPGPFLVDLPACINYFEQALYSIALGFIRS